MKFSIDLDITPEELRRVLGWPDVQELHKEVLDKARQQIADEGVDLSSLLKPYSTDSVDQFQRLMMQMMSGFGSTTNSNKNDND